jgi:hypothetical protein
MLSKDKDLKRSVYLGQVSKDSPIESDSFELSMSCVICHRTFAYCESKYVTAFTSDETRM